MRNEGFERENERERGGGDVFECLLVSPLRVTLRILCVSELNITDSLVEQTNLFGREELHIFRDLCTTKK